MIRQDVEGNTARRLSTVPNYTHEKRIETERRRKAHPKMRKKADVLSIMVLSVALVITLTAAISFLQTRFESTYLSKNIANLETQVLDMQKQNETMKEKVNSSLNLSEIYNKATQELGMVHAGNNQVFSYDSKKSDQVRQYGEIPKR